MSLVFLRIYNNCFVRKHRDRLTELLNYSNFYTSFNLRNNILNCLQRDQIHSVWHVRKRSLRYSVLFCPSSCLRQWQFSRSTDALLRENRYGNPELSPGNGTRNPGMNQYATEKPLSDRRRYTNRRQDIVDRLNQSGSIRVSDWSLRNRRTDRQTDRTPECQ